ncbi:stalk domain-containing protein [Tepidanaerobacter acetatoxydans]|uniref:stalk domain-containing protein n=1 Tax=Tepidanaerobacter acetatoxydans TaxID=499229 RepID=UPI0026EE6613|nr:stalk domain-containing protein [Tepidanaerobacter acetatoxydans]
MKGSVNGMKLKKRIIIMTVFLAIIAILIPSMSFADIAPKAIQGTIQEMQLVINGQKGIKIAPILYEGRAYLPARYFSENMGYKVDWDQDTFTIFVTPTAQEVSKTIPLLDTGKWAPATLKRLQKMIDENGIKSPNYDPKNKPYAVFDWDQTCIFNDTQEELFRYQIKNLLFKMTPSEFAAAIRHDIPSDDFSPEYNNLEGKPVNIEKIGADLDERYKFLYDNYISLKDKNAEKLAEIQKTEEFKDFQGKLAYLYEAIGGTFSANVSYPWVLYLFTGMTTEEAQAITEESNDIALGEKLEYYTLTSSSKLPGKAGVVTGEYKRGLRIAPEMSNLMNVLRANGIDVYICSASLEDVVKVFAGLPKYGYNVPSEHAIGMRLEKDIEGKYKNEYKKDYPQTQQEGKTEAIKRILVSKYGYGPIFVAGDSQGDYNMATDFEETQLVLIINRVRKLSDKITILAKKAADSIGDPDAKYILQGRNENYGLFIPQESTIRFGKTEAELIRK